MFCINCGTELPDKANFCFKCGKPQGQELPKEEIKWEMCEIVWEQANSLLNSILIRSVGCFTARAIGVNGVYIAGKTQSLSFSDYPPPRHNKDVQQAINDLAAQLGTDGWEPIETKGVYWFEYRFRRKIKE